MVREGLRGEQNVFVDMKLARLALVAVFIHTA
jgi:hypothetical protein